MPLSQLLPATDGRVLSHSSMAANARIKAAMLDRLRRIEPRCLRHVPRRVACLVGRRSDRGRVQAILRELACEQRPRAPLNR